MKKQIVLLGLFCCIAFSAFNIYAASSDSVDIHGFVSQGYLASDSNNYMADTEDGTFDFNEFGINFSTEIGKTRIGIQILSRDLGEFGNNEPTIDWAVADYRMRAELGFQFGKIKMPIGLFNQGRDVDLLRVPVLLPASVYDEGARDNQSYYQGGGIYGTINTSVLGMFKYEVFGGNIQRSEDSLFFMGQQSNLEDMFYGADTADLSMPSKYIAGGSLQWSTPLQGLRVGYSYNQNEFDTTAEIDAPQVGAISVEAYGMTRKNWVASVEYTFNDLILVGELAQTDVEGDMLINVPFLGMAMNQELTMKSQGWYVQATNQFTDWLAAGIYYSEYYPDRNDKDGDAYAAAGLSHYAWQKEVVPTVRFDVTYSLSVKAEVHFVDGAAQVYDFNNPDGREQDWMLYALKATLSF